MTRRKKRSIVRTEHGAELDAIPVPPAKLLKHLERDAGRGLSVDPAEMIWSGGGNPIDVHELLRDDLDDVGALDQILLAIIGTNCDFPFPPEAGSAEASRVRHRLGEAKKHLLGRKAKQGPPSTIDRRQLHEIARRYWLSYAGVRDDASLRAIAVDVIVPEQLKASITHKEADDFVRSYIDAFNKDKDRLLLRESSAGLPEFDQRHAAVATIIDRLTILELVRPGIAGP